MRRGPSISLASSAQSAQSAQSNTYERTGIFPFQQLPTDIRRLIYLQPGAYPQLAALSTEQQQFSQDPLIVRQVCNRPLSTSDFEAVNDYFDNNVAPVDILSFVQTVDKLRRAYEDPANNLAVIQFLNLDNDNQYHNFGEVYIYNSEDDNLGPLEPIDEEGNFDHPAAKDVPGNRHFNTAAEAIQTLSNEGYVIPAKMLYTIYRRRFICMYTQPNYALTKVLEFYDREVNGYLNLMRFYPSAWDSLRIFLVYFLGDLVSVPDEGELGVTTKEEAGQKITQFAQNIRRRLRYLLLSK